MTTRPSWDAAYLSDAEPAPRDIGRPQPAFVRLADRGLLSGRLLDAGCGTISIEADTFDLNPGMPTPTAQAWLATICRT